MSEISPSLKKAKFWNMLLLLFGGIGGIIGIMGLPAVIDPAKQVAQFEESIVTIKDPALIESMSETLEQINQPLYRGYTVAMLVLSLILVACFFQANLHFNKGQTVSKWPYYLHLGKILIALIVSFLSGAVLLNPEMSVVTIVFNLVWCLPAVLVLRHLQGRQG